MRQSRKFWHNSLQNVLDESHSACVELDGPGDLWGLSFRGVVVGAVAAEAVPSMASGIVSFLRPLGKKIIQGGLVAYATVSEMFCEIGEHFNDILAEAKAEIEHHDKKMPRGKAQHA